MQLRRGAGVGNCDAVVGNREPFVIAGRHDGRGIAMVVKSDFGDRSRTLELKELLPDGVA